MGCAIIALVVVVEAATVGRVSDQMAREADARLDVATAAQADSISSFMAEAARDLRLARQNAIFERALETPHGELTAEDRRLVEEGIEYLGSRYEVDEICLIRADGLEVARWERGNGIADVADLSPDELVNNPAVLPTLELADDRFFATDLYPSPDSGRWVVGLATPIVQTSGPHLGILHFEIAVQAMADALGEAPIGGSSYPVILDQSGRLLSHPRLADFRIEQGLDPDSDAGAFPEATASGSPGWKEAAAAFLEGGSGAITYDDGGSGQRASYAAVAGSPWIVAVVSPTAELYADADRARWNVILTVGPLVVLMLILGAAGLRRMSTTNRELREQAVKEELLIAELRSEARLRSLAQNSADVNVILGPDGVIEYESAAVEQVLGFAAVGRVGQSVLALAHPDERDWVAEALAEVARVPGAQRSVEFRTRHADGSWRTIEAVAKNMLDDAAIGGIVMNYRDTTTRKNLENELRHQAFHDTLTGLANRALFTDRLDHALSRRGRSRRRLMVAFIDLDDFKTVNDSLGHAAGDQLLVAVAQRLRIATRAADTIARMGGDEFAVLVEDGSDEAPVRVAERLLATLRAPFELDGKELYVRASGGVAVATKGQAADELLRNADIAMYRAKSNGKDRVEQFEPSMHTAALARLAVKVDLERALERDELFLVYQPLVDLRTHSIHGIEALVRWRHPERGIVGPSEFIPIAEDTGLIIPIGHWVLAQACRDVPQIDAAAPGSALTISVNVSGRELTEPDYVARLSEVLRSSGLEPSRLVLELTEGVLLANAQSIRQVLQGVRNLGVRLALDDFGTGYSSLSYLNTFPIDILKIDQAFVSAINHEPDARAIIQSIVSLSEGLRLLTVAEGIEDDAQLHIVRELGADIGQGYLFAKPVTAADLSALLAMRAESEEPRPADAVA